MSRIGASGFINCVQNELHANYEYEYIHTERPLEICLGYGFSGPVAFDIEAAPHTIIASTTGGGKSTLLKGMICSLIQKSESASGNVLLNLADFQKVELGPFRESKYVQNFASTPTQFMAMLQWLKAEHYRRLDLFWKSGVGGIQAYNHSHSKKPLPYIVTICDEFGELMGHTDIMNELVLRAAEDRKVGQHLIISTQRPSTNIISGDIRANFSDVIALKVKDKDNSRLVLDEPGAERLRGRGHALLKHAGTVTEFQCFHIETDRAVSLVRHTFENKERKVLPDATKPKQGPPDRPLY